MLTGALRQLFALSEAYPDLKANQNFQQLQSELSRHREQARRRAPLLQQRGAGVQYRHPAVPGRAARGLARIHAEGVLRRGRRGAQGARTGAAGEVLIRASLYGRLRALHAHPVEPAPVDRAADRGLFLLVYVLTYAGALVAEALIGRRLARLSAAGGLARLPLLRCRSSTIGTALWILIAYKFHQSMIDAVTGGHEVTRQEEPRLYNLLENLCISRGIPMPKLKVMESDALNAFATGLNEKQYSITVTSGLVEAARRRRARGRARPRAHPHPQRRRAHAGDRGDHRRRDLVLRRARLPADVPGRLPLAQRRQRRQRPQGLGRRRARDHHRGGDDRARLAAVDRDPLRAVAQARISRRCRRGRADQEPGRA